MTKLDQIKDKLADRLLAVMDDPEPAKTSLEALKLALEYVKVMQEGAKPTEEFGAAFGRTDPATNGGRR